jgi:arginyl-tRNA synthetase
MKFSDGIFSTRKGNVIYLSNLLDEAEKKAYEIVDQKNPNLTDEEKKEIARVVGIGAVKYSDLSQNRTSTIIFDWDKMLSFEGNTAPYLQYTYARIQSVFKKGEIDPSFPIENLVISNNIEREIILKLIQFPNTIIKASESYKPNIIADYIYDLAQTFNTFYNSNKILVPEDKIKYSRLLLCQKVSTIIKIGLDILGIEVIERM